MKSVTAPCPACGEIVIGNVCPRCRYSIRTGLTLWSGGGASPTPVGPISPYQRYYFTRDGINQDYRSPISPGLAAWDDTSQTGFVLGLPWRMLTAKSSAMNNPGTEAISAVLGIANHKSLILAYVSDPIVAGTISGTAKGQMRWEQDFADCAHDQVTIALSVVSSDGLTNRGYLLPLGVYGSTGLYALSPNPFQNRFLANGDAMTPVVSQAGDRLFLEIGTQPTTQPLLTDFVSCHLAGQTATDLPENETSTSAFSPWFQLSP